MPGLIDELKRRRVFRTAAAYLVASWLLLQVTDTLAPILDLPDWTPRLVFLLLVVGFVPALIISWAYELRPESRPVAGAATASPSRRNSAVFGTVAAVLVAGIGGGYWYAGMDERWATNVGLPQLDELASAGQWEEAYALASRIEAVVPGNQRLADLWQSISWVTSIDSEPQGARVYRRAYEATDAAWALMGTTPLTDVRVPYGLSLLRLEADGHAPLIRAIGGGVNASRRLEPTSEPGTGIALIRPGRLTLDSVSAVPEAMVRVPGRSLPLDGRSVVMNDFHIGRYEVTNSEYQVFLDAGGYERPEFWEHEFIDGQATLDFDEAMARFVDSSGVRPGPATWIAGNFPEGEAAHPVGGISWYEAAAYAKFAGYELPTIHHWRRAFAGATLAWMLPTSNVDTGESAAVGEYGGIGWTGSYDMAGNVREWCANAIDGQRVIVGGSWSDPAYSVQQYVDDPGSLPAFDRSPENGLRLALTRDPRDVRSALFAAVDVAVKPTVPEPVSDDVFDAIRNNYAYDKAPLNPVLEETLEDRYWIRERVRLNPANGESLPVYLYLPRAGQAPFQAVVYWPTTGGLILDSIEQVRFELDFVIRSGRAVAVPILAGTYERRQPGFPDWSTNAGKNLVINQVKDFRRTIDYLEARTEIHPDKLAFYGYSWGGRIGPIVLAVEPRLKAGILNQAGLQHLAVPETSVANFLPRVTAPVLQFNGRYDTDFRFESSALPFFELLGSTEKLHVVEDTGHFVPRIELVGQSLNWLDLHLGPVRLVTRLPAEQPQEP